MTQIDFTPTRAAGLARMAQFQPSMGRHYSNTRNHDYGPDDRSNLSVLSPWVRNRLITEQELASAALSKFALSTAEKFVQEVCWRTYWKGWLQHRPKVWDDYLDTRDEAFDQIERNSSLRTAYEEAIEGRTGIAVFDAWVKELVETGYLANHSRMWFSSIWIYTLNLPWELGADFFLQNLMDGDAASNTLSWRWTGGLHTQGKTYLARASNIAKYAENRFERKIGPDWRKGLDRLANDAPPLNGRANPGVGFILPPDPMPDGPVALLLTEEDLHPASLVPETVKVEAIAGASFAAERSPKGCSKPVERFVEGALENALSSAGDLYGATQTELPSGNAFHMAALEWARGLPMKHIITGEPPAGWIKPHLDDLKSALADDNIKLSYVRRDWDDAFWPHAKKGFFGLKKRIPSVLAELGLPV
ncbi:MAG: FAD-binding domain-containing protein [Pseudomonadota bacterium]